MRFAEAEFGGETIGGGAAVAQSFFDGAAKGEADAIEVARDAGFVFGELPADFGEGLLLGIIEAKALLIAGIESGKGCLQSADEKSGVAFAMRIGGLNRNGLRNFVRRMPIGRFCVAIIERFKAAAGADGVNVSLGENGAKPGLERAAAVEITEERTLAARAICKAVEFSE